MARPLCCPPSLCRRRPVSQKSPARLCPRAPSPPAPIRLIRVCEPRPPRGTVPAARPPVTYQSARRQAAPRPADRLEGERLRGVSGGGRERNQRKLGAARSARPARWSPGPRPGPSRDGGRRRERVAGPGSRGTSLISKGEGTEGRPARSRQAARGACCALSPGLGGSGYVRDLRLAVNFQAVVLRSWGRTGFRDTGQGFSVSPLGTPNGRLVLPEKRKQRVRRAGAARPPRVLAVSGSPATGPLLESVAGNDAARSKSLTPCLQHPLARRTSKCLRANRTQRVGGLV